MAFKSKAAERLYIREWQRLKRQRCRDEHICVVCQKTDARPNLKTCQACMPKCAKRAKKHRKNVREQILKFYGNFCECCGESDPMFLTLDHINNDGTIQRAKFTAEHAYYAWIVREAKKGNIQNDLRTLCYNCNLGRFRNGGVCPHKQSKEMVA